MSQSTTLILILFLPLLRKGRWVGFTPNVRHILTFCILTVDTHQIIYHSAAHSTLFKDEKNLNLKFSEGEDDPHKQMKQVLHTQDTESDEYETLPFSPLKPDDLIRHTFLTTPTEDGQHFHAHIIQFIEEINDSTNEVCTKFLVHKSDDELDEIMGYHELLEILEEQHQQELENDIYQQFKHITGPQGPLRKKDPNYKGCNYNVTVEWEDRSITHEPLNSFGHDAPETCAECQDRNMTFWMNLDGSSFVISPHQKRTFNVQ